MTIFSDTENNQNSVDSIKLEDSWKSRVGEWLLRPEMQQLSHFLKQQKIDGVPVFPQSKHIFSALDATSFENVKVVILGQDPYHGPGQAHGLSFSVLPGISVPPSLVNIYKELEADLSIKRVKHGYLMPWAKQGVLLLNAVLTVEQAKPNSHQGKGWEGFTDHIITTLSEQRENIVFLLWGSYAQAKSKMIDSKKHCILKAPHPSPLSAHRGFFGCKHFSAANDYLVQKGQKPINWQLSEQPEIEV